MANFFRVVWEAEGQLPAVCCTYESRCTNKWHRWSLRRRKDWRFVLPPWSHEARLESIGNQWKGLFVNQAGEQDEILTVPEVASLLKVDPKTVYTMVQRAEMPAFKVRGQWRFQRVDIAKWIEQQKAVVREREGS